MDFGVMMFPTDYAVAADELARMAEDRGFESLFFPEHTHIPASRETDYPGGDELPRVFAGGNGEHVLDRVIAYGDEWLPNRIGSAPELEPRIDRLRRMSTDGGRKVPKVGLYAAPARAREMESHTATGVGRYVLFVPPVPRPKAEARLDHLRGVIDEYRAAGS